MDTFKDIYRILSLLEKTIGDGETDLLRISSSVPGSSIGRVEQLLIMLSEDGHISGVVSARLAGQQYENIVGACFPVITLKGLEYLECSDIMLKVREELAGVGEN